MENQLVTIGPYVLVFAIGAATVISLLIFRAIKKLK